MYFKRNSSRGAVIFMPEGTKLRGDTGAIN